MRVWQHPTFNPWALTTEYRSNIHSWERRTYPDIPISASTRGMKNSQLSRYLVGYGPKNPWTLQWRGLFEPLWRSGVLICFRSSKWRHWNFRGKSDSYRTLPETKPASSPLKKMDGWNLEYDRLSYWVKRPIFRGYALLLVSGRVIFLCRCFHGGATNRWQEEVFRSPRRKVTTILWRWGV